MNDHIEIKGAKTNNLKNVDLTIPKNQLIVFTGLSGSGKSSITMDTLFAEGQRRYVESLSSYARQFLDRMKKPEVDYIRGICPAISIEQHRASGSSRSTVGSLTEINDYLRLLFARAGKTYSPISGKEVIKNQVQDVVDFFSGLENGDKVIILVPIQNKYHERPGYREFEMLLQKGYNRYIKDDRTGYLEDWLEENKDYAGTVKDLRNDGYYILLDRLIKRGEEEELQRVADTVGLAFAEFYGTCILEINGKKHKFNNRFELDDIEFIEPSVHLFNSNNPIGACPKCEGFGRVMGISEEKVIPNPGKSLYEGAIACWAGEKGLKCLDDFIAMTADLDFPIHEPYESLSDEQKDLIWHGNHKVSGIYDYFAHLEKKIYKIQNRVILSRFRGRTKCPECKGNRLRKEAGYVKIGGLQYVDLIKLPIADLRAKFEELELDPYQKEISKRLLLEIKNRLYTMDRLGLGYLDLLRRAGTLSGGETQRIHLTRLLSSNLTDSLYILDEPSIGLHPRDTAKLTEVLKELRDLDNTVIVVEHEEDVIKEADYIVDIGPGAGIHGGEVVYSGPKQNFLKEKHNLTSDYLSGRQSIPLPEVRRKPVNFIQLENVRLHNLKNVSTRIPLQTICVVSGVSGSGKSTLVKDVFVELLQNKIQDSSYYQNYAQGEISGDYDLISQVEFISQSPLGRSSRSNPATYVNAYDLIRKLMSEQAAAKIKGLTPKHFSFNVEGGRCETCKGEGEILIEMQFLADVKLTCEECKGQKFKDDTLAVEYKGKNIYDILSLSIEESLEFFKEEKKIAKKLKPLQEVGLGYVKLGQATSSLSGGEAQRVKLASYLANHKNNVHNFFIFDEPTTGLHFHDIHKLMYAFNALVEKGHSLLIVEHNLDVIKSADWVIDLGPGGGLHGGEVLYQGPPEGMLEVNRSETAKFLKKKIEIK